MNKQQHQLETVLSGEICSLYKMLTGHSIILSDCRFLNDEQIALVFEDSMTPVENLFVEAGLLQLSRSIRFHVDEIFHHQLSALVQKITRRSVIDILSESKVENNRKGIILILGPTTDSEC